MHSDPVSRRTLLALAASAGLVAALPAQAQEAPAPAKVGATKIGVIGAGNIGSTIGGLWAKAGHDVMLSSRHPEALKGLVEGSAPRFAPARRPRPSRSGTSS